MRSRGIYCSTYSLVKSWTTRNFFFGDSISQLEESEDEVAVTFASGRQRSFSLVLGCDGTHSAVRKMCFGEESSFLLFLQCYFSLTIVEKLLIKEKHVRNA